MVINAEAVTAPRVMLQPAILPIRVVRTNRPPISLQEGVAAYAAYQHAQDTYHDIRRQQPHPTYSRLSKIA